jgi:hypothetical protein
MVVAVASPRNQYALANDHHIGLSQADVRKVLAGDEATADDKRGLLFGGSTGSLGQHRQNLLDSHGLLARPKRFELLTPRFVVWCTDATYMQLASRG